MESRLDNLEKIHQQNVGLMAAILARLDAEDRSKRRSHALRRSQEPQKKSRTVSHHKSAKHPESSDGTDDSHRSSHRHLPIPEKQGSSPSLKSSQTESRTRTPNSQSRTTLLSSQESSLSEQRTETADLSPQLFPSANNSQQKAKPVREESFGSQILSKDFTNSAQGFPQSTKKTELNPPESLCKKTNKEDEIEEQSTITGGHATGSVEGKRRVIRWPNFVSPNLATDMDFIPSGVSSVDLLIHPCSIGNRVLIASETGLLKIKNIAEDKAVLVKNLSIKMFSEHSYIDRKRKDPEVQEDHAYPFYGEYAIISGNNKPIHDAGSLPADISKIVQGKWVKYAGYDIRFNYRNEESLIQVAGVQKAEWQPFVDSMIRYIKLGLHNPWKALEGYLKVGDIYAKTDLSLSFPDVFDIFTRVLQRMVLKSYQQALGEVVVAPKILEKFYGNQAHVLARYFGVSGNYLGQNSPGFWWSYGLLAIVTSFKAAVELPELFSVKLRSKDRVKSEANAMLRLDRSISSRGLEVWERMIPPSTKYWEGRGTRRKLNTRLDSYLPT